MKVFFIQEKLDGRFRLFVIGDGDPRVFTSEVLAQHHADKIKQFVHPDRDYRVVEYVATPVARVEKIISPAGEWVGVKETVELSRSDVLSYYHKKYGGSDDKGGGGTPRQAE